MIDGSSARSGRRFALVAIALGGLVYLNALHNPFVYDDYRTIVENGSIGTPLQARAIVMHEPTRPLVNLSYAIDRALWGTAPFGFHLTNLLLHLLNIALLFAIAQRLAEDQWRVRNVDPGTSSLKPRPLIAAFVTAALFAVHPMMTEAVGYISARPDVLSGALFLLAFLAGRRWMHRRGIGWWILSVGLWVAALLAKETAIVLPVVLFCYEWLVLARDATERRYSLWRLHVPLVVLALAAGTARLAVFVYVERAGTSVIQWREILGQAIVTWRYAGLLLVPRGQTIFHDVQPIHRVFEPQALIAVVALVAVGYAVMQAGRRYNKPDSFATARFGVIWFALLLAPSSALVVIDRIAAMAEHRAYLASCGLFLATGSVVGWLSAHLARANARLRVIGSAAFAVVLLSLGSRTVLRNAVWADPVSLWLEAAVKAPASWLPRTALGESLHEAGRHEEAIAAYTAALALNPGDDIEYMNLAICLSEVGRPAEAVSTLNSLVRLHPQSPIVPIGLGTVAMLGGDLDRARRYFLDTLASDPRNVMARQLLAALEERAANPAEALRRCEEIQQLAPGNLSTKECIRRNRARLATRQP